MFKRKNVENQLNIKLWEKGEKKFEWIVISIYNTSQNTPHERKDTLYVKNINKWNFCHHNLPSIGTNVDEVVEVW